MTDVRDLSPRWDHVRKIYDLSVTGGIGDARGRRYKPIKSAVVLTFVDRTGAVFWLFCESVYRVVDEPFVLRVLSHFEVVQIAQGETATVAFANAIKELLKLAKRSQFF